ncbi:hypothetical protein JCM5353_000589 [Sporobolomyces roseus]
MSSSQPPANEPIGCCVVCGKETATRCSACSAAGLDWMFFCSIEHQKLIWFLHKRVCGTNPFRWPEFSKKEIDEMVAYSKKPTRVGDELTTWLNYVVPHAKSDGTVCELQEREKAFRSYLEQTSTQKQITTLRVQAYQFHYNTLLFEGVGRIKAHKVACAENPINWFVSALERGIADFAADPAPYQPWWSDFNHRYLDVVAIMYLMNSAAASSDKQAFIQMKSLYEHTYGEALELLKSVIPLAQSAVVERLVGMARYQIELLA